MNKIITKAFYVVLSVAINAINFIARFAALQYFFAFSINPFPPGYKAYSSANFLVL